MPKSLSEERLLLAGLLSIDRNDMYFISHCPLSKRTIPTFKYNHSAGIFAATNVEHTRIALPEAYLRIPETYQNTISLYSDEYAI